MQEASPRNWKPIQSLRELEFRLGATREHLRNLLVERSRLYAPYERLKQSKRYPGKNRLLEADHIAAKRRIDNPLKQIKDLQQKVLRRILCDVELPHFLYGAVAGKTVKEHAGVHLMNQRSTVVRMDVSSYYPSVTCSHVYFVWNTILGCSPPVAKLLTELTTFEWHLPQGSPTSPALGNIFLSYIVRPVLQSCDQKGIVASIWVDDLVFSGRRAREVMELVRATLAQHGLRSARRKRFILGHRDEKTITGVRLGKSRVRAPYQKVSDLRAAIHRLETSNVAARDLDDYRRNLLGRISHIEMLDKSDARALRLRLGQNTRLRQRKWPKSVAKDKIEDREQSRDVL